MASSMVSALEVAAATLSMSATNAESVANGMAAFDARRLFARATEAAVAAVAPAPTSAARWARVGFFEGPGIVLGSSVASAGT
jgi:hypothetical protein